MPIHQRMKIWEKMKRSSVETRETPVLSAKSNSARAGDDSEGPSSVVLNRRAENSIIMEPNQDTLVILYGSGSQRPRSPSSAIKPPVMVKEKLESHSETGVREQSPNAQKVKQVSSASYALDASVL